VEGINVDDSQFAPHFYSEAKKVSRALPALNRVTVLPTGANFCKACSLNGMPRREILS